MQYWRHINNFRNGAPKTNRIVVSFEPHGRPERVVLRLIQLVLQARDPRLPSLEQARPFPQEIQIDSRNTICFEVKEPPPTSSRPTPIAVIQNGQPGRGWRHEETGGSAIFTLGRKVSTSDCAKLAGDIWCKCQACFD